jgi:hypothetical protein
MSNRTDQGVITMEQSAPSADRVHGLAESLINNVRRGT